MKITLIFESLIYFFCISTISIHILDYKIKKIRYLLTLLFYLCILFVVCHLENTTFNVFNALFPIVQVIASYLAFSNTKISSILYIYTCIYCTNTIIALFISIWGNIAYERTIWLDFIIIGIVGVLCIILCYSKFKTKLQYIRNWTPLVAKRLLLVLLVVSTFLFGLVFDRTYYTNSIVWFEFIQKGIIIAVIMLLVIVCFLIYVMISNSHLKQLTANYEQQINEQAKHYQLLAASTYELRCFKHDFKNMSIAVEHLLQKEGHSEALELFRKYNGTLNHNQFPAMRFDTGNGIADALLADKHQKALAHNSTITFQGCMPANILAPTDICVILGNTLDNAIEACAKLLPEDSKSISVTCNCNSGFLFLSICNPIAETVNIKDNYILTTKKNKTLHGFGLYSLNTVLKNYDGHMELKAQDNIFTIDITLCLTSIRRA